MKQTSRYLLIFTVVVALLTLASLKWQSGLEPEKLDWDIHFQGEPDANSAYAALTVTNWNYSYNATVRGKSLHIDFNFTAGVNPSKSWVKRNRIRNRQVRRQLLNHEQGHVYINFFLLRESDRKIRNQRYTVSNYKRLIRQNANKLSDYYSKMQDRYDVETKHGTDLKAQERWDIFFKEKLDRY